ncbi:hypothetical protein ACFL2P_01355 [Candidatus Moduliflexota bacterium]
MSNVTKQVREILASITLTIGLCEKYGFHKAIPLLYRYKLAVLKELHE